VAQRELARLIQALNNPELNQDQRDQAAKRLVQSDSAGARQAIDDALSGTNPGSRLAVARALGDVPQPDVKLSNKLLNVLLDSQSRDVYEAASRALVNYRSTLIFPDVLTQLLQIVQRRPTRPDRLRREVIKALGSVVEKRVAEALVSVLRADDETPEIRRAAADALESLTGISQYGQDEQQWATWWEKNRTKSEVDFRAEVLPTRSAHVDRMQARYADLNNGSGRLIRDLYEAAAPAQRADMLLRLLTSTSGDLRVLGAGIVQDDFTASRPIPQSAREELRRMVGDSDPKVRIEVAKALGTINDSEALEPLLAQLLQEKDEAVRAALADALGPINDLRAVDTLLGLLNDRSIPVARAAARSIGLLGAKMYRDESPHDRAMTQRVAQQLLDCFGKHPAAGGNADLRETLVEAMAPLKSVVLQPLFTALLNERAQESTEIRRRSLRALGELGRPDTLPIIEGAIDNRAEARVRFAAVEAIGKLPNAEQAFATLRERLGDRETDPSVRQEAWEVLKSILPKLTINELQLLAADFYPGKPANRVDVLKALEAKQEKDPKLDELASTRENIGASLKDLNKFDEAADYFNRALEDRRKLPNSPSSVIDGLISNRIKALLRAGQYPTAREFAAKEVAENAQAQRLIGPPIRDEVMRLKESGRVVDLRAAQQLLDEAQKINPPMELYTRDFVEQAAEVRKLLAAASPGAGTPPAQSGSGRSPSAASANGQ
jgi:HEAT repeat protein